MSHPSAGIPTSVVSPQDQLDLCMTFGQVVSSRRAKPFHMGHLSSLTCGRSSVFRHPTHVNWFYNALRIHWKVKGRLLDNVQDHADDLVEFLSLEVRGVPIIQQLLSGISNHYLQRSDGDALLILALIIRDLYKSLWSQWTEVNTKPFSSARLIIAHAQNANNQLSNFVQAFEKAHPALRDWAEETAAQHLRPIITRGHLPKPTHPHSLQRALPSRDCNTSASRTETHTTGQNEVNARAPSLAPPSPYSASKRKALVEDLPHTSGKRACRVDADMAYDLRPRLDKYASPKISSGSHQLLNGADQVLEPPSYLGYLRDRRRMDSTMTSSTTDEESTLPTTESSSSDSISQPTRKRPNRPTAAQMIDSLSNDRSNHEHYHAAGSEDGEVIE